MKKKALSIFSILICASLAVWADQYEKEESAKGAMKATLTCRLENADRTAKDKMAIIACSASGVEFSDPGLTPEKEGAHLHYQLDDGAIVATPAQRLMFANLTSGKHTITVTVVNHHHKPVSEPKPLNITVP